MKDILFILPDERDRLPGPEALKRAGFRVSSALEGTSREAEEPPQPISQGDNPPRKEPARR